MNIRSKYISVYHESCINHELEQKVNIEKIGNVSNNPSYEIHIKCLKGHNLHQTNPKCCEDYDMTTEPFGWKLSIMEGLVNAFFENEKDQ